MTDDDWLSEAAYDYLDDLSLAGLSWEFLRRNPGYCAEFEQFMARGASSGATSVDTNGAARDWGLVFPCGPISVRT